MKLLLDANLSWKLVAMLNSSYPQTAHVDFVPLSVPAKDTEIWNFALKQNFIIVSNDEDFLHLINVKGFPPKLFLLRTGNQSTGYILQLLLKHVTDIEAMNNSGEYGLLEIY